ncbi:hypothetical protein [Bradyrhizobium glycinis]|uniref:hypothetical protein n=1 Tax=Bradyrhizobium glycinis TaxID=2751812 RepID=UPI0018D78B21|nr:hypothetical protein [Bradyrhizobium glycinis]MBH5371572.1 hypothetical protein [Bradyrhizobium glycinis]
MKLLDVGISQRCSMVAAASGVPKELCMLRRCNPSIRVASTNFTLPARSKHRELKADTAEHDNEAPRKTAASPAQRLAMPLVRAVISRNRPNTGRNFRKRLLPPGSPGMPPDPRGIECPFCARRADAKYFFADVEHILVPMLRNGNPRQLSKHTNEEAARLLAADARLLLLPL